MFIASKSYFTLQHWTAYRQSDWCFYSVCNWLSCLNQSTVIWEILIQKKIMWSQVQQCCHSFCNSFSLLFTLSLNCQTVNVIGYWKHGLILRNRNRQRITIWSGLSTYYLRSCLFIFRERGGEGERERNIMSGCLSHASYWRPGLQPKHVVLIGNQTSDPLVPRLPLNPPRHTSQGIVSPLPMWLVQKYLLNTWYHCQVLDVMKELGKV